MKLFGADGAARLPYASLGRTALEAALALTTGLLLARFAWVIAAPGNGMSSNAPLLTAAQTAPQASSNLALLTHSDPFSQSAAFNEAAVPTSLNLKIAGLRWSSNEHTASSAVIILPDNSQKRVAPGELIVSGAVLDSVAADRVFLRYNGQLQELLLSDPSKPLFGNGAPSAASTAAAPQAPATRVATAPAPAQQVTPALLLTDVDLTPELRNGAVAGYRLSSRGQGYFEAAGLESGDLVLRVNGASIEGMGPEAIQSAVMSSEMIALDVVRKGAIVRLRLSPDSGLAQ
ncbi:hypothetical protein K1X12_12295 [Hyphomonas sp. WL0036]|uniref:type II secretion system protein N n=1 Tax=Hyphomonas sediminis TaxID=2866160 RepID=UPI001C80D325|nr:type II secretion system protein N [Hyphomonas sediminis]MBY9067683.1 hypothetical protein [Hyphomonas sediminis]